MDSEKLKCVYVMMHERMRNLVKVGWCSNIKKRVSVLNTSVPEDFTVVLVYKTDSCVKIEKLVIQALKNEGLHKGSRPTKEFFKCDEEHVKQVIDQIVEEHPTMKGSYLDNETIKNLLRRTR